MRSLLRPLVVLILLIVVVYLWQVPWATLFTNPLTPWPTSYSISLSALEKPEAAVVTEVYDGDTVEVNGREKVRFLSIDTPETHHPKKSVECFGLAASEITKKLLTGRTIYLERDVENKDLYDRLLRYVYLPNPQNKDEVLFVNAYLVGEGFARELTVVPNVKYESTIHTLARRARDNNMGLWGSCEK